MKRVAVVVMRATRWLDFVYDMMDRHPDNYRYTGAREELMVGDRGGVRGARYQRISHPHQVHGSSFDEYMPLGHGGEQSERQLREWLEACAWLRVRGARIV